ncbi:MAG: hypothetical protein OXC30_05665 [Alphaproteobacteria bacterium]|nr:hypothetical protein [Alphaproteobacteria bacterium]
MILILLFFTCVHVYGSANPNKDSATLEQLKSLWWSNNQKLIDGHRTALAACFQDGIDGQTYHDESNAEKLQQFIKPIIDILKQIESPSCSNQWPDIVRLASDSAVVSNAFDTIKSTRGADILLFSDTKYASFFRKFLLCVEQCCAENKCQAMTAYADCMTVLEQRNLTVLPTCLNHDGKLAMKRNMLAYQV